MMRWKWSGMITTGAPAKPAVGFVGWEFVEFESSFAAIEIERVN